MLSVALCACKLTCSYTGAKKDNDFVYHDRVLEFAALEPIAPAMLAKAVAFDVRARDVLQGEDLFRRLLPLEVHSAASLYSEEKARLLRAVTLEIGGKNKVLESARALLLHMLVIYSFSTTTLFNAHLYELLVHTSRCWSSI